MPLILSHVDLRVRDRAKATEFYDAILNLLGATKEVGTSFTTWQIPPSDAPDDCEATEWFGITEDPAMTPGETRVAFDAPDDWEATEWFGITEHPGMTPGETRVAFDAPSRGTVDAIAVYLPAIGATNIEWSEGIYGPNYYAVFFDDPDGNKLEVCHIGPPSRPSS